MCVCVSVCVCVCVCVCPAHLSQKHTLLATSGSSRVHTT